MQPDQILPLIGFIFAMVGTPGPNNLMLMAAGANFGFRRSLPHIMGISVGCQTLLLAIALGLGQLLDTYPLAVTTLRIAGSLFLLNMAVQLLRSHHFLLRILFHFLKSHFGLLLAIALPHHSEHV